jgi:porphobilinogen deaminase
MADKIIRIGTRDSELALWQAHTVEKKLNDLGYKTEIVAVKAQGSFLTNLFMNSESLEFYKKHWILP